MEGSLESKLFSGKILHFALFLDEETLFVYLFTYFIACHIVSIQKFFLIYGDFNYSGRKNCYGGLHNSVHVYKIKS